jgi:hypothetical protein
MEQLIELVGALLQLGALAGETASRPGKGDGAREVRRPSADVATQVHRADRAILPGAITYPPNLEQCADVWVSVAQELGLTMKDGRLAGTVGERLVEIRGERRQLSNSDDECTIVAAPLVPRLDLGLTVEPQHVTDGLRGLVGLRDIRTGDADFDDEFLIGGDEAARVLPMLPSDIRHELQTLRRQGDEYALHDGGIEIMRLGAADDRRWLMQSLERAARIARRMDEIATSLAPAAPLAAAAGAWAAYARQAELSFASAPLSISGRMHGLEVRAIAIRSGKGRYQIEAEVAFQQPLHLGLEARGASLVDRVRASIAAAERRVGDADFDDAFRLRSTAPDAPLTALLDAAVRRKLLALLHRFDSLRVCDRGVAIRIAHSDLEPDAMAPLLAELHEVAAAMSHNARVRDRSGGPYR